MHTRETIPLATCIIVLTFDGYHSLGRYAQQTSINIDFISLIRVAYLDWCLPEKELVRLPVFL